MICMTVEEAARALGVKVKHVYYLAYMGKLEGWKIRGAWRLFSGSVEAYASEQNTGRTHAASALDTHDQGRVGFPSLFGFDCPPDDLGRPNPRLHAPRRERVEYHPGGLPFVPFQALQPVTRPVQLSLFAEAV